MDKYEIAVLAEDYEAKREIWRAHAIANTPKDAEARRKSMIAFHVAEAEMLETGQRLERAKLGILGQT
jgi:hypothetical protein